MKNKQSGLGCWPESDDQECAKARRLLSTSTEIKALGIGRYGVPANPSASLSPAQLEIWHNQRFVDVVKTKNNKS